MLLVIYSIVFVSILADWNPTNGKPIWKCLGERMDRRAAERDQKRRTQGQGRASLNEISHILEWNERKLCTMQSHMHSKRRLLLLSLLLLNSAKFSFPPPEFVHRAFVAGSLAHTHQSISSSPASAGRPLKSASPLAAGVRHSSAPHNNRRHMSWHERFVSRYCIRNCLAEVRLIIHLVKRCHFSLLIRLSRRGQAAPGEGKITRINSFVNRYLLRPFVLALCDRLWALRRGA